MCRRSELRPQAVLRSIYSLRLPFCDITNDFAGWYKAVNGHAYTGRSDQNQQYGDNNMLLENTEDARNVLAGSPCFAMSLGAKELFHTNFLGFLLETEVESLDPLRKAIRDVLGLPVHNGERSTCAVWREKGNLDLILVPQLQGNDDVPQLAARALVIEAKLKSIPTEDQLAKYLTKTLTLTWPEDFSTNTVRLSLSGRTGQALQPARRLLTPCGETIAEWEGIKWTDVADAIAQHAGNAHEALRSVLQDYAQSLQAIIRIVKETRACVTAARNDQCYDYTKLHGQLTAQSFRTLRIHDLVGKIGYDELLRLFAMDWSDVLRLGQLPIRRYVHFSRGQPGFGCELTNNGLTLGVQIQGTSFRRYVSVPRDDSGLEREIVRRDLVHSWFRGSVGEHSLHGYGNTPPDAHETCYGPRLTNLRVFNSSRFVYSATSLSGVSLSTLAHAIQSSLTQAHDLATAAAAQHAQHAQQ